MRSWASGSPLGDRPPQTSGLYYFNTKELVGNKYGTPSPVPFRVVDQRAGIDMDIGIRCFGEYSYRVVNPILFYTNVCGNISEPYTRDAIDGQLKTELMTALQPAFAKDQRHGHPLFGSAPGAHRRAGAGSERHPQRQWSQLRGIEIVSLGGLSSVKASEEDEQAIKEMQRAAALMDPTRAAAHLVGAQADAMRAAAANIAAGPAMAFMGMQQAAAAGGAQAQTLYQMGTPAAPQPVPSARAGAAPAGMRAIPESSVLNVVSPAPRRAGSAAAAHTTLEIVHRMWAAPPGSPLFCLRLGACRPGTAPQVLSQLRQTFCRLKG